MSDQNDWRKQALDLGPVLLFVAGYLLVREKSFLIGGREYEGFVIVTACFIPLLMLTNWLLYKISGKVSRMQIFTLVLAVVFGGLTVGLNDERFFKMKSTLAFGIFSGLLWVGIARGQSWLEFIMDGALPITHEGWMILTKRLAIFFAGVAAANEIIWRGFSTDVFVAWDTFGQMAAMMAFFVSQAGLLKRHSTEDGGSA
ncbi:inner membrane-spanning protein YciB [Mangrovicoccus sp. HB161399]|uniref:inner membrane-spanning protein YciB n=1 Tax=Mangrovicoccus sp. HB161399 TaxID=2720392 RepID=UPI0015553652|nr:inner membrane-spanning protein YciB [Mangrovicoccus sp. HB161399]